MINYLYRIVYLFKHLEKIKKYKKKTNNYYKKLKKVYSK